MSVACSDLSAQLYQVMSHVLQQIMVQRQNLTCAAGCKAVVCIPTDFGFCISYVNTCVISPGGKSVCGPLSVGGTRKGCASAGVTCVVADAGKLDAFRLAAASSVPNC
jgi:hypothetical protein